ncbi:hypothetical protein RB608_24835 [Nocardioides sp. LHD-245]|uniref:hypothetical protein n=1 Tax=Nocardioides sp. LHD-245 TaxID=3051387 RepID=UPI0027E1AD4A|nr:hypothetical protein [Nocardioides sp. LHD-245]
MSGQPLPSFVAVHEAGHAVAAWACGFVDPGEITVIPFPGLYDGACASGRPPVSHFNADWPYWTPLSQAPDAARRWVECQVTMLLAGEVATKMFHGADPVTRLDGPDTDNAQVEVLLEAVHLGDLELAAAHRQLLALDTQRILHTHRRRVLDLARELDTQGTLPAERWWRLLDESADLKAMA